MLKAALLGRGYKVVDPFGKSLLPILFFNSPARTLYHTQDKETLPPPCPHGEKTQFHPPSKIIDITLV